MQVQTLTNSPEIKAIRYNPELYKLNVNDLKAGVLGAITVNEEMDLFKIRTANECLRQASSRPIPRDLYKNLWFEGELCILFADTNTGKSIKAVQIGNEISEIETVLYFDFELSDKQFESRYSENYSNHFIFNNNFLRIEINPDAEIPENKPFEKYLNESITEAIIQTGAKILIIDNLTYLRTETEKAKDALPLMKELKALKKKHDLSILALAHTPKRDASKQLTRNDLQGSKMLINFCDSAFAIGESFKDKNIRYIKQIKVRETEMRFDSENVILYDIRKPSNYLHFNFLGYDREFEHLKLREKNEKELLIEQIKQMHKSGKTQRQISQELTISLGAVNKYINS